MLTKAALVLPPKFDSYGHACEFGRECAAHFVESLKQEPHMAGSNRLGRYLAGLQFPNEKFSAGYYAGFFSHLERFIVAGARGIDVFADLERIAAIYAAVERQRGAEPDSELPTSN